MVNLLVDKRIDKSDKGKLSERMGRKAKGPELLKLGDGSQLPKMGKRPIPSIRSRFSF